MWHAVVLKDNSFRFLFKEPADGLANTMTATKVAVAVEVLNLARPINLAPNHFPGGQDLLMLPRPAGIGAVAGDVNPLWRVRPYGLDHLPGGARTTPGQEKDRGLHAGDQQDFTVILDPIARLADKRRRGDPQGLSAIQIGQTAPTWTTEGLDKA
jgi:hypothetical protein